MPTGYDAVDVSALPPGGDFYLAYLDGAWPTYQAVRAKFPKAQVLSVTVTGKLPADIIDVETGDATPAGAAAWVRAGKGKGVYSDTSTHPALVSALAGLDWWWYAADPTGVPHIVPGSLATQWAWPGHGSPGNYDISQSIPVAPPPHPQEPPEMTDALYIRWCYMSILCRPVDAVGFAANMKWLAAGGSREQVYTNLCDSAEGQHVIAARRKSLGL